MLDSRWKEAEYIAQELNECIEDVYDVLLGNITKPKEFVYNVNFCSAKYHREIELHKA